MSDGITMGKEMDIQAMKEMREIKMKRYVLIDRNEVIPYSLVCKAKKKLIKDGWFPDYDKKRNKIIKFLKKLEIEVGGNLKENITATEYKEFYIKKAEKLLKLC